MGAGVEANVGRIRIGNISHIRYAGDSDGL
jgi:hypothetical protein